MRFEIADKPQKAEDVIQLELCSDCSGSGAVYVVAVYPYSGNIIRYIAMFKNGRLYRSSGAPVKGLETNSGGRIVVYDT